MEELAARVREAHADAMQTVGRAFPGGSVGAARGVRMMASGLQKNWYNHADVTSEDADVDAIAAFFAQRGVPYGMRVAAGMAWPHGRRVVRLRLMAVAAGELLEARTPDGVTIEVAGPSEVDELVAVDCAAFGSDPATVAPWISGLVRASDDAVVVACARRDGVVVGTGYAVHADGAHGRSVGIGGVGVVPAARRIGIGAAITSRLAAGGFAAGAALAQLAADDERAARLYRGLGFADRAGIDVYVP